MLSITRNSTAQDPFVQPIVTICLVSLHQIFNEKGRRKKDTHLLEFYYTPDTRLGSRASSLGASRAVPLGPVLRKALSLVQCSTVANLKFLIIFEQRSRGFTFHGGLQIL